MSPAFKQDGGRHLSIRWGYDPRRILQLVKAKLELQKIAAVCHGSAS